MIPRYAVVNQYDREVFENEWQLPYGYAAEGSFIYTNPKEAIRMLHLICEGDPVIRPDEWIVEKISEEGRELYYRM